MKGNFARMAFEPPQRLVGALGESDEWLGQLSKSVQEAADRWELDVERVIGLIGAAPASIQKARAA